MPSAAPGGIVGINAGLIFHAETEGQVASVVSHELAHLSQRHFARRMQRQKDRSLANSLMILASIALAGATSNPNALWLVNRPSLNKTFLSAEEMNKKQIGLVLEIWLPLDLTLKVPHTCLKNYSR